MNRITINAGMFLVFTFFISTVEGAGRWSRTGDLVAGRCGAPVALLTNGQVVVIGTQDATTAGYEVFNPATGTWFRKALPSGVEDATAHTPAILLPNGKILYLTSWGDNCLYNPFTDSWVLSLMTEGVRECGSWMTLLKNDLVLFSDWGQDCYLYNYTTDAMTATGNAPNTHYNAPEILLPSGDVLIIAGASFAWGSTGKVNCEIYNPVSQTWMATGSMNIARSSHGAVHLPPPWDDKILAIGGVINSARSQSCELYSISGGTWTITDSMDIGVCAPEVALLPNGKVLVTTEGMLAAQIFDPATEIWSLADSTEISRGHGTSVILPTGKVLALESSAGGAPFTRKVEIYDPSNPLWTVKPALNTGREAQTVTILPIIHTANCSTNVLIAGGRNGSGALNSCELYNYCEEAVTITGNLNEARERHIAVLLVSKEVLAAGGRNGSALNSCELFNAAAETWTLTSPMAEARFDHTATLLSDGRVLVTGGENTGYLSSCEIYDAVSWNGTGSMGTMRARHSAVILLDGKVLVIGGQTTGGMATETCELWDGSTWTATASLSTARYWHTATLLQSGKVLVIGGTNNGTSVLSSCEIYDPVANTWTAEGTLNTGRFLHNSTLLYSGLVLTTGGFDGTNYLASCEIWDPAAEMDTATNVHRWKITASLSNARGYHSSVLIPDVQPYIISIGGNNGGSSLNSIEEYDIGLGYRDIWQSTITNSQSIIPLSYSMHIEGTLFRGVSEADGGNYCHIASNDHPIMSFVRIGGGNWQGNGGGEFMYMPLSDSWDSAHTDVQLPADAGAGYYRMWSIVNGIPCKWCKECGGGAEEISNIKNQESKLRISNNPFERVTTINYQVAKKGKVLLAIYDLSGRVVKTLANEEKTAGNYKIDIDASDLTSGIYLVKLTTGNYNETKKLILMK